MCYLLHSSLNNYSHIQVTVYLELFLLQYKNWYEICASIFKLIMPRLLNDMIFFQLVDWVGLLLDSHYTQVVLSSSAIELLLGLHNTIQNKVDLLIFTILIIYFCFSRVPQMLLRVFPAHKTLNVFEVYKIFKAFNLLEKWNIKQICARKSNNFLRRDLYSIDI